MPNSIADRLATLNTLRAVAGKRPLVSWKASSADLDQAIADHSPTTHIEHKTSTPIDPNLADAIASSDVAVTKLPASPELRKAAKRTAIIKQIADTSVKNDKPTTVIDAKAAARQLRNAVKVPARPKATIKSKKPTTTAKVAPAKRAKTTSPSDFHALLAELGKDPKQARATLRRKGFNAPYTVTAALKAALVSDDRKK